MDRKEFVKKSLLGVAGLTTGSATLRAKNVRLKNSTFDQMMQQVGFNHLPNQEIKSMKSVLHKADTRGHANHGWLNSHHTFSFANYYHPDRMNFGVLRVLNDDEVAEAKGFGTHPHDNMEIISIPLEGDLEHKDSMGNTTVIKQGDVQVMSAGTGIYHSEYNKNADQKVKFLQIWMFPNKRDVKPRYDQISLDKEKLHNQFHQILSPTPDDDGVWVHQNAWFLLGDLKSGIKQSYQIKDPRNGVYVFVLEGSIEIDGNTLERRDGYGVWDIDKINITAMTDARVLLMDVPMQPN
jgi:redox-sensitive bicupin YhaK (pirin superfamily)